MYQRKISCAQPCRGKVATLEVHAEDRYAEIGKQGQYVRATPIYEDPWSKSRAVNKIFENGNPDKVPKVLQFGAKMNAGEE